jgi:hypothetical protein
VFGRTTNGVFGAGEPTETTFQGDSYWAVYTADYGSDGSFTRATLLQSGDGSMAAHARDESPEGVLVIGGYVNGAVTLGASTPRETVIDAGPVRDPFVGTWKDGAFDCTWRIAGTTASATDQVDGVAFDGEGGFWVAGRFSDTITLAPDTPEETALTSAGGTDVFLARFLLAAP